MTDLAGGEGEVVGHGVGLIQEHSWCGQLQQLSHLGQTQQVVVYAIAQDGLPSTQCNH